MNEKRQNNILFGNPKEESNVSDPVARIISLKRKATEYGQWPLLNKLRIIEKSIVSQKNLSKKTLKSTLAKIEPLEAELNVLIIQYTIQDQKQNLQQIVK